MFFYTIHGPAILLSDDLDESGFRVFLKVECGDGGDGDADKRG